eukprot:3631936-Pyramimonas_sp.AAC.1
MCCVARFAGVYHYKRSSRTPVVKLALRNVCSAARGLPKIGADGEGTSHAKLKRARVAHWA